MLKYISLNGLKHPDIWDGLKHPEVSEAAWAAGVCKMKAAVGTAKETVIIKYFSSSYFVGSIFRVGDSGLHFSITGDVNQK